MKIGLYALLTAGLLLLSGCSRDEDSHPEVQIYPVLSRVWVLQTLGNQLIIKGFSFYRAY